MTVISKPTARSTILAQTASSPALHYAALALLCSAYIQGPLTKIFDFDAALGEMSHFGLPPGPFFPAAVIIFELAMSALVISGFFRWVGSLLLAAFTLIATLVALRFWEYPPGPDRMMAMNGFFEHMGLIGGFLLVAAHDFISCNNRK